MSQDYALTPDIAIRYFRSVMGEMNMEEFSKELAKLAVERYRMGKIQACIHEVFNRDMPCLVHVRGTTEYKDQFLCKESSDLLLTFTGCLTLNVQALTQQYVNYRPSYMIIIAGDRVEFNSWKTLPNVVYGLLHDKRRFFPDGVSRARQVTIIANIIRCALFSPSSHLSPELSENNNMTLGG
jgi:hypothetical protein